MVYSKTFYVQKGVLQATVRRKWAQWQSYFTSGRKYIFTRTSDICQIWVTLGQSCGAVVGLMKIDKEKA
jgi:hypothetical protein